MNTHNKALDSIQNLKQIVEEHKLYKEALSIIAGIKYHTLKTTAHSIAEAALNNLPLPPGAGIDPNKQTTNRYFKPTNSLWPVIAAFDHKGNPLPSPGINTPQQIPLNQILEEVQKGTWKEINNPLLPSILTFYP